MCGFRIFTWRTAWPVPKFPVDFWLVSKHQDRKTNVPIRRSKSRHSS